MIIFNPKIVIFGVVYDSKNEVVRIFVSKIQNFGNESYQNNQRILHSLKNPSLLKSPQIQLSKTQKIVSKPIKTLQTFM